MCRIFEDNPFPLPKHIDSFFFPGEQTSVLCLCKTHLTFLFCVWVNTNISINTNFMYIYEYCLQYVCMCMSVPVSVCVMSALVKFHVNKRCLTLWEITELNISGMVPLLSAVQTMVVSWASCGRGSLVGRGISQSAWPTPTLPSPERWSGEGSSQALCDKVTQARGAATPQENFSGERTVLTSQQSQPEQLFMPMSSQGNQKSVWICSSHRCASLAWPRGPGTNRQKRGTKPTPCKPQHSTALCLMVNYKVAN